MELNLIQYAGQYGLREPLTRPTQTPATRCAWIEESVADFEKLSLREQLEFHRQKESCNDCHRTLDPWGIALEEYSAEGLKEKTTVHKSQSPLILSCQEIILDGVKNCKILFFRTVRTSLLTPSVRKS